MTLLLVNTKEIMWVKGEMSVGNFKLYIDIHRCYHRCINMEKERECDKARRGPSENKRGYD